MKLPIDQLAEALRAREQSRMEAIRTANETFPVDSTDTKEFQMVLKKKRLAGVLKSALKEGGYGDLAKLVNFKQAEEQQR